MSESIEVRYAPTPLGNGVTAYHKYIIYTDSAGIEHYARGGPESKSVNDYSSNVGFGEIVTESGLYTDTTIDWDDDEKTDPSEPIDKRGRIYF